MKPVFTTARGALSKIPDRAYELYGKLGAKNIARTAALAASTLLFIGLTGLVGASAAPLSAPLIMLGFTAINARFLGRAVDRLIHDTKETVWKNDAGQTIRSTHGQKANLEAAQARIYRVLDRAAYEDPAGQKMASWQAQNLSARFWRAAAHASVVKDITPPAKRFTFARRGPALPIGEQRF